jgi:hypothetical protein
MKPIEDFLLETKNDISLNSFCLTASHKALHRSSRLGKFAVKIPSVSTEKFLSSPKNLKIAIRSNSLTKVRSKVPMSFNPNVVHINFKEDSSKNTKSSKSIKVSKPKRVYTAKENSLDPQTRYSYSFIMPTFYKEKNTDLEASLSKKVSNVIFPLPLPCKFKDNPKKDIEDLAFGGISNVMIPLHYSDIRILESKRQAYRLRKFKRLPAKFEKENHINN